MERKSPAIAGSLKDYWWLIGPEGRAWLARVGQMQTEVREPLRIAARLRKELVAEQVRLLLEQTELRRRAVEKFPHGEEMFFTRQGLEQATDFWVAGYKAERIRRSISTDGGAIDFCCGIGGDLMALAVGGPVRGMERDPIVALLAKANLESLGPGGDVVAASVEETVAAGMNDVTAWHIDPDRRPAGGRTTRVELHEPGPEVLRKLLDACSSGAIKLAPAA
ncbi:MAG TPA: hypothetical protein VGI75_09815, partial [Pirellulales bacterium]